MKSRNQFPKLSFKKFPINDEKNFLTTLQDLQSTAPRIVEEKEKIKCKSQYLKALKKLQNSSPSSGGPLKRLRQTTSYLIQKLLARTSNE